MANAVVERFSVGQKIGALLFAMLLVAGISVGAVYYFESQTATLDNSIDTAGEQRMLTERMLALSNEIAAGDADEQTYDRLEQSLEGYEANLQRLRNGGTVDGEQLDPAPTEATDELATQRETWDQYSQYVETLLRTQPQNPQYQEAVSYIASNNDELLTLSDDVVTAYVEHPNSDQFSDEINVAGRQRMLSQRITQKTLFVANNEQPGETTPAVAAAKEDLAALVDEFGSALDAMADGGTHRGVELQAAPESVQTEIAEVREVWDPFSSEAVTVSSSVKFNQKFVDGIDQIRGESEKLFAASAATVEAFGTASENQTAFMQNLLIGLFALNTVIFVGGLVVARRLIGKPIAELTDVADTIASGSLDIEFTGRMQDIDGDGTDARDEVVRLAHATREMEAYLTTVAQQAQALADQEFDDPVLDEDVPGEFGQALSTMRRDIETLVTDIEQAKADAEQSQEEAEALATALEQKAIEFSDAMERAADGDLTQRLAREGDAEAMAEIADAFNEMIADIETTMSEIQSFATEVATETEQASASADEVKQTSESVSESIQQIATGAQQQREKLDQVSGEMNNLSAAIEEAASSAQTVAELSDETATVAKHGEETAEQAIDEIETIQTKMESAVTNVEELDTRMAEIGEIVDVIGDIAEQTNMLALNANIEAARAGEAGGSDGFAVVADEVKQLAEETQHSAGDIAQLIDEVQAQTETTVREIRETQQQVDEATAAADDAVEAFATVTENVNETNAGVQEISRAMDAQATSAEEAVSMADDVADISQTTADESANVSAAAEEQASSMTQITANVESLAEQAEQLQSLLDTFETDSHTATSLGTETTASAATTDGGQQM
ncbi:Methyl-accepting chemotaxis protein [Halovenus aranensis]|uniref:Methyl-accepting chemotaxis protein n=1 Tax=Halovenus aranensis TaxID=890420 RepID=A0A1G8VGD8_9EURY|nr:methyl-accepting chemotaxis protein [Halovenus aranensis]SDJ64220.1 Methyl-accepting chemotaxis protein [Halovenus aranensis]